MNVLRTTTLLALALLFPGEQLPAQSIYKCKTPGGVMFSEKPCGEDAKKLSLKASGGRTSASRHERSGALPAVPVQKFDGLPFEADAVIAAIGPPAASYTHRGTEHWLYPNAVREEGGQRACPELLFEDGQRFQTNWLPEDVMHDSVRAARAIGDWQRRAPVQDKRFYAVGEDVRGAHKAAVVRRYGEPDAKKVHAGREWWEYERVPVSADNPQRLTLFVEFDGDVVASAPPRTSARFGAARAARRAAHGGAALP